MKIVVIYGTRLKSKSSTYNIAQRFIKILSGTDKVTEFFLPESMPKFCIGCRNCFTDYTKCPDYTYLKPIMEAMLEGDLLIFTAPVYVGQIPGQMKAFLDHLGYQSMAHQPRKEMFGKRALLISTAAGSGTKPALKTMESCMSNWGISGITKFGKNVHSGSWDMVDEKIKLKIQKKINALSSRIIKTKDRRINPSLYVRSMFYLMRFLHKTFRNMPAGIRNMSCMHWARLIIDDYAPADINHWESRGWLKKERPW